MGIKRVSCELFDLMLKNGLENLKQHEEEINRLNVFPVSDGDTGTNMRFTLENGLKFAKTSNVIGEYLKQLSKGMLFGARGNSGVILSQFFKGFCLELARCKQLGIGELRNGFIRGYRVAYSAIVTPVEGTILTVTREGIEHIRAQINRSTTVEQLLSMYIAEMRKSLAITPELLPPLKEAGVVDSGALGYITIIEGMLKYLYGELLISSQASPHKHQEKEVNLDMFDENSPFKDGYCMEFILQLMNSKEYNHHFQLNRYIEELKVYGNSLIAVQDKKRVKVHIHTLKPARIITLSQEYGEFLQFKLENMQIQHNEHDKVLKRSPKHKELAIISVVNGEGMKTLFSNLGCDVVIDGGPTMNTSSQEFIDAFSSIDADNIVILPNNPNVILAAEQASNLSGKENITVIPSRSMAEGYFAIAMDVSSSSDISFRIKEMQNGLDNTVTLCEATASRNFTYHELKCKKGEEIALIDNNIVCVSDSWKKALTDGLSSVEDIEDKETCVIFRGVSVPEEYEEILTELIQDNYPDLEVEFIYGGQNTYHWILGLM